MTTPRQIVDALCRESFGAFVYAAFGALYPSQQLQPNWHIEAVCLAIERSLAKGKPPRLIVNLPPRSLKSFIISVCLPAWLLGRDPTIRILAASYSEELANQFSRQCRMLMETSFYRRVFPRTRLNPRKTTESEFETTRNGGRLATSVGGTMTGRGGQILIIDDPLKAADAASEIARRAVIEWFRGTALSRLDQPKYGAVFVVMQRLHVDDLAGILMEGGWPSLSIPAVATERRKYALGPGEFHTRQVGELLQPRRDSKVHLEQLRIFVGSHVFAAQYQQNPTPPEGNRIMAAWLKRYDKLPERFDRVILSCDPSGKAGDTNDYTAIAVFGIRDNEIYVLEVLRGHWTVMQMRERVIETARHWKVDLSIIEDTSTGMGLVQLLEEERNLDVIGLRPDAKKEVRLARHQGKLEFGRIMLPREAQWLAEFENELLTFPFGRYDDQVDALLLFLDWYSENEAYLAPLGPFVCLSVERENYPWD